MALARTLYFQAVSRLFEGWRKNFLFLSDHLPMDASEKAPTTPPTKPAAINPAHISRSGSLTNHTKKPTNMPAIIPHPPAAKGTRIVEAEARLLAD
jgi:hypothetical protein